MSQTTVKIDDCYLCFDQKLQRELHEMLLTHHAFPAISKTIMLRPWKTGMMIKNTRNKKQMKNTMVWIAIPAQKQHRNLVLYKLHFQIISHFIYIFFSIRCLFNFTTTLIMMLWEYFIWWCSFTKADDCSLVSYQTHPTDDTIIRWRDGFLAVINVVNISFI